MAQMTLTVSAAERFAPIVAEMPGTSWSPAPSAIESEISFFDWVGAVPTARQHSYPYAVGPPLHGIAKKLRVAGNALPGDSSTRRSPVSRIARVSVSAPSASLMRLTDSGPSLAESFSLPSSALRGEPDLSPQGSRRFRPFTRLVASAREGAAALSS